MREFVSVVQMHGRWRVIDAASGKIAKTWYGTPIDQWGHATQVLAERQAHAVNARIRAKLVREGKKQT